MVRTESEVPYKITVNKACPRCNSTDLKFKDILYMKILKKLFKLYDCKECNHRFVVTTSINKEEEI